MPQADVRARDGKMDISVEFTSMYVSSYFYISIHQMPQADVHVRDGKNDISIEEHYPSRQTLAA